MSTDKPPVQQLSNVQLLEEYADMVRWWHYDPLVTDSPSTFEVETLEAELRRRLELAAPASAEDEAP